MLCLQIPICQLQNTTRFLLWSDFSWSHVGSLTFSLLASCRPPPAPHVHPDSLHSLSHVLKRNVLFQSTLTGNLTPRPVTTSGSKVKGGGGGAHSAREQRGGDALSAREAGASGSLRAASLCSAPLYGTSSSGASALRPGSLWGICEGTFGAFFFFGLFFSKRGPPLHDLARAAPRPRA